MIGSRTSYCVFYCIPITASALIESLPYVFLDNHNAPNGAPCTNEEETEEITQEDKRATN
jgi:hypothetical protein